jgi:hypothetical protein
MANSVWVLMPVCMLLHAVALCHPLLPRQVRGSVYVLLCCATRFCHGKRGGLCVCCCVVPPASATVSEGVCVCAVALCHLLLPRQVRGSVYVLLCCATRFCHGK